jgi:selenocysteine-specific elongation factor
VTAQPPPTTTGRVRLWVDRAFSITGSGTVVTGTLGAGTLRVGDALDLRGRLVRVRALQSLGKPYDDVPAIARVAVNLRGVEREEVSRGDALLTPDSWRASSVIDVRLSNAELPAELVLHVGSAGVPVRVRPLGGTVARLTLRERLPLQPGDRAVLRDPGGHRVAAGAVVLDVDPPPLQRRGAAAARAEQLTRSHDGPDLRSELARRGALRRADAAALGLRVTEHEEIRVEGDWLIAPERWARWCVDLTGVVDRYSADHPLEPAIPGEEARRAIDLPDLRLLSLLAAEVGLEQVAGRIRRPGVAPTLGADVERLAARLDAEPFAAPERPELDELGIGRREIAAAVAAGRLLRLPQDVLLPPDAPARAMRLLAALPQPFTVSAARQALGTTRRVAIPLLEHLDARGWTRRLDGVLREVVR